VLGKVCSSRWARYIWAVQCFSDLCFRNGRLIDPLPDYCDIKKHLIETAAYVLTKQDKNEEAFAPARGPKKGRKYPLT